jgi:ribosome-associated heat shock protein Hsp15
MDKVRIDKWLWAARFFKTRSLATDAVNRGKVRVAGDAVKPAKDLKIGDALHLQMGEHAIDCIVMGVSDIRRGAPEAKMLYEETAASQAKREAANVQKKLAPEPAAQLHGRPTKRQRRDLDGAKGYSM